jgi:iron complex transport system substrate-binding protein
LGILLIGMMTGKPIRFNDGIRDIIQIAWVILTGMLLISCENNPSHSSPVASPRIVSLAPNLTEILYALGLEDHIAAVTIHCNYPAAAESKPRIGSFWQPDIEGILASRPDLLVALDIPQHQPIIARLKQMGCSCLTLPMDHMEDLYTAIESIAVATGHPDRGQALIQSIQSRLKPPDIASENVRPKILWVIQREPLRVAGTATFIDEMIRLAGGINAIGPTVYEYPPIGAEELLIASPDIIIEPAERINPADHQSLSQFWARFPLVPAARDHRLYLVPSDVVSRLGPRIVEGVEKIAYCIQSASENP